MLSLTRTKRFYFDKAQYRMADGEGNEIILKIDYKNKKYDIVKMNNVNNEMHELIGEAKLIAFDLIGRKSNNNRVDALNRKK